MYTSTPLRGRACVLLACVSLVALPLLMNGCSAKSNAGEIDAAAATEGCVTCHSNSAALTAAGLPEDMTAESFLVSAEFLKSDHAAEGCVSCHGGDPAADKKDAAMAKIVADPSADPETCGQSDCHEDVTKTFDGSLHSTASGILEKLTVRLSKSPNGAARAKEVFYAEESCFGCHATCGQCHVSVPAMFGGGLLDGHMFTDATDQESNDLTCAQCHDSIGPMYVERDLHHEMGYSCADCHDNPEEVHGDGTSPSSIDEGLSTVECADCHEDLSTPVHSKAHLEGATCDACHSVAYESCQGCHAEDGSPEEIVDIIKLGKGDDGRITPVTHMGLSEEMFGEPALDMNDLNTKASWILAVPHTVQPAKANQQLCDRCHGPGSALLKDSDLQFPDFEKQLLLKPLAKVKP